MTRHRDGGVRELRFRAETVTPLFMAGAVPGALGAINQDECRRKHPRRNRGR